MLNKLITFVKNVFLIKPKTKENIIKITYNIVILLSIIFIVIIIISIYKYSTDSDFKNFVNMELFNIIKLVNMKLLNLIVWVKRVLISIQDLLNPQDNPNKPSDLKGGSVPSGDYGPSGGFNTVFSNSDKRPDIRVTATPTDYFTGRLGGAGSLDTTQEKYTDAKGYNLLGRPAFLWLKNPEFKEEYNTTFTKSELDYVINVLEARYTRIFPHLNPGKTLGISKMTKSPSFKDIGLTMHEAGRNISISQRNDMYPYLIRFQLLIQYVKDPENIWATSTKKVYRITPQLIAELKKARDCTRIKKKI